MGEKQTVSNSDVADALERVGDLLEAQGASPFRSRAFHRAAGTVRESSVPVADVFGAEGLRGLDALPAIGPSIASAIREILLTGRLGLLERLEGEVSPEDLLRTVPGIGPELARRLHEDLGIDTLEALEVAAHDGSLARVPGFGARRVRAIRDEAAGILARAGKRRARAIYAREHPPASAERPPVSLVLAVDEEYRREAEAGRLRRIAPRRFNPEREAWLPILHVEKGGWAFTALFSNTERAHRLGRTRDWVVVYGEREGREERCTVVTERSGPLRGRRVVRGREAECLSQQGSGLLEVP